MIKKSIITLLFLSASLLMADMGAVSFSQSNQNITTAGFENNEYDYMLDPFLLNKLDRPWLFLALDTYGSQFGNNFAAGWVTGKDNKLNFIISYENNSNTVSEELETANNDATTEFTDTTKSTPYDAIDYNLQLHSGFLLSNGYGITVQLSLDENYVTYDYSNNDDAYDTNGVISAKGTLTERTYSVLNDSNGYSLDIATGISLGDKMTTISAGLSLNNSRDRIISEIYTEYNDSSYSEPNTDAKKVDSITTLKETGQIDNNGNPLLAYDSDKTDVEQLSNFEIDIDTITSWESKNGLNMSIPFELVLAFYNGLEYTSEYSSAGSWNGSVKSYKDDTNTVIYEDSVIEKHTLDIPLALGLGSGFGIDKSFEPSSNSTIYLGAESIVSLLILNQEKGKEVTVTSKNDTDQNGTFDSGETNTVVKTVDNGISIEYSEFDFTLQGSIAGSFTPVELLSFHASATPVATFSYTSTKSEKNTGDSVATTDNIDSTLSETVDTKGTTETTTNSTTNFGTDLKAEAGVTINISDSLKIDCSSVWSTFSFSSFAAMIIFSY